MIQLKDAGIDWLTLTSKDDGIGGAWYQEFMRYAKPRERKELGIKQFYNGFYSGVKCGKMSWGYNERIGYILVVTGGAGELYYLRYYPELVRVTRVDLRVDVIMPSPRPVAERWYEVLVADKNNQRKATLFKSKNSGGNTLYVGSRQSMQYGRIYDKGAEAGIAEPGVLWRFEVEYKKPIATQMYAEIVNLTASQRVDRICGTVSAWFEKRGVAATIGLQASEGIVVQVEKQTSTAQKKINWLRTQVAPTVRQLVEAGYGKDVLRSLLLDEKEIEKILEATKE